MERQLGFRGGQRPDRADFGPEEDGGRLEVLTNAGGRLCEPVMVLIPLLELASPSQRVGHEFLQHGQERVLLRFPQHLAEGEVEVVVGHVGRDEEHRVLVAP